MRNKWSILTMLICMLLIFTTACGSDVNGSEQTESQSQSSTESESNLDSEMQTEQESESVVESEVGTEKETETQGSENTSEPELSELESSKPEPSEFESESESESESDSSKPEPSESESSESESLKPEPSESEQKPTTSETTPPASEDNIEGEPTEPENSELESSEPESSESESLTEKYTVTIKTTGGYGLYNVKVHVYKDSSFQELVLTKATNGNGVVILDLVPSDDYVITLSNIAEGYQVNSSYAFKGKAANIRLSSSLITDKDISTARLREGNVMYDLSVTSANGETLTLSEILKEKKMVMLNFWYVNCEFCVKEFPAMSTAYEKYKDDIEIIALNPFDSMDAVQNFLGENPLPFEVATCPPTLPSVFGVQSYPVSIIVDQYGVIRHIENGAILESTGFERLFNNYTR